MRTISKRELLLVPGYALLYILARECSVIHEHPSIVYGQLAMGLRFAAFLFLPARLWPYLIAGDLIGSAYYRIDHLSEYGWAWFISALVFPLLSVLFPATRLRATEWLSGNWTLSNVFLKLLQAAGAASILNAITGLVTQSTISVQAVANASLDDTLISGSVFTLGNYLGMLLVVPFVLSISIIRRLRNRGVTTEMQFSASRVVSIACCSALALGALIGVRWWDRSREIRDIVDLLMFTPAIWMTVRYGWTGAVVATVMANLGLQVAVLGSKDTDMLVLQVLMALVSTALLLLGAHLTEYKYRYRTHAVESDHHLQLARKNLQWGETRVRRSALQVERAFVALQTHAEEAAEAIQLEHGAAASAMLRWHGNGVARSDIRNVISGMQVNALETRGLKKALLSGPLATQLRDANISFAVRVPREMHDLPSDMSVMLYRLAYDLVMMLTRDNLAYRVSLRLRVVRGQRRSIAMVIKVWPGGGDLPPLPAPCIEIEDVRAIAQTYKGLFHDRRRGRRPTIGLVLRDF